MIRNHKAKDNRLQTVTANHKAKVVWRKLIGDRERCIGRKRIGERELKIEDWKRIGDRGQYIS
jgi:hypothetical protein